MSEANQNMELLNQYFGGIQEHIKAEVAKSVLVRFDTHLPNASMTNINNHF
jgi:hypothetical protein